MKKILLFLLLVASPAFAGYSIHINAVNNNIGTSYTGVYPQLALTNLPAQVQGIYIVNSTGSTIALTSARPMSGVPSTVASGATAKDITVLANSSVVLDHVGVASNVYLRSDSGSTITSGDVYLFTF